MVRRLIETCGPLAAAAPGVALGIGTLGLLLMTLVGEHPLWRVEAVNMSEAAALRDRATIVALIARGEDPYARRPIRADLLFNDPVELTPIEAGIAAGRSEIVQIILFSAPKPLDAATWTQLRCLSEIEHAKDINDVLDRYRPAAAADALTCDGVTKPWKDAH